MFQRLRWSDVSRHRLCVPECSKETKSIGYIEIYRRIFIMNLLADSEGYILCLLNGGQKTNNIVSVPIPYLRPRGENED